MFSISTLPPQSIVVYEVKDTSEEAPDPGTANPKRNVRNSESEQILRGRRMYVPRLVDIAVEGTTRVGQHWT